MIGDRGELHQASSSAAIRIIKQTARRGVVDDAVIGVGGDAVRVGFEIGRIQRTGADQLDKDRVLKPDRVVVAADIVEVGKLVDIGRGAQRRVKTKLSFPLPP